MAGLRRQFSHHNSSGRLQWQIVTAVLLPPIPMRQSGSASTLADGENPGTHARLCLQAEEKKYEPMGGCGQQRFLQEKEGEPDVVC